MSDIHISIKSEEILHIGDFVVTNSMLGSTLVLAVLFFLGAFVKFNLKKEGKPTKVQLYVESLYIFLEDIVRQSIPDSHIRKYLGLVIILFLYIIFGSWLGLLPGVLHIGFTEHDAFVPIFRAPTTDLNATTALAIIAFLTIQYSGFSSLGLGGYMSKFFSLKNNPLANVVGLLELLFEFVRLVSFSFRLFGNIFAGEVLIVVVASLTKFQGGNGPLQILEYIGVPIPSLIILLEFFVAIIQAYVFINLMTVFIALAAEPAHHNNDEAHT